MFRSDNYKYYKVLECSKDSSHEEVKRSYHRLALLHHPDKKSTDSPNSDKFLEIEEAWRILSHPESRKKYNAECRQVELESENILIHDRINFSEMKMENGELMSFPCRCGYNYVINKNDFDSEDGTVYISCQECTFSIAIDR